MRKAARQYVLSKSGLQACKRPCNGLQKPLQTSFENMAFYEGGEANNRVFQKAQDMAKAQCQEDQWTIESGKM
jgi:hypothetical protein